MSLVRNTVPLFEKASTDKFYVDLTGMDKYHGCFQFTTELRQKIKKESGLPLSLGLASNKLISKVATNEAKEKKSIQPEIPLGFEKPFLAPFSVMKLPGVGKETGFKFLKMGVETIKTRSEIPVYMLENLIGKNGHVIKMDDDRIRRQAGQT